MENPYYRLMLALGNTQDAAFCPAVGADRAEFHQHFISMHGIADVWRWHKDVALQLAFGAGWQRVGIRGDKAVAIAMHLQAAHNQVLAGGGSGQTPTVLANSHQ